MNQSRETATNSPAVLEILAIFYEAFAERDAERRERMLARCLTPDAEIWGHSQVFAGYAAISEKIAGFHNNFPDCRLVLASGPFVFENILRLGGAIIGPDGSVIARSETVMEFANDGRIHRVVPLWEMELPPLPDGWPEHLAVPKVPHAPDAA
jgi:hypothetical protein